MNLIKCTTCGTILQKTAASTLPQNHPISCFDCDERDSRNWEVVAARRVWLFEWMKPRTWFRNCWVTTEHWDKLVQAAELQKNYVEDGQ